LLLRLLGSGDLCQHLEDLLEDVLILGRRTSGWRRRILDAAGPVGIRSVIFRRVVDQYGSSSSWLALPSSIRPVNCSPVM
jgi:hypothetical protein